MAEWSIAGVPVPSWALKLARTVVGAAFVAFVALKVVQELRPEICAVWPIERWCLPLQNDQTELPKSIEDALKQAFENLQRESNRLEQQLNKGK